MKTKNIFKGILATGLMALSLAGCDDVDPLVEEVRTDRVFSPVNLRAFIRNVTTIELDWRVREDAEIYEVEFARDSLEFNDIILSVEVSPGDLPFQQEDFDGNTVYSARVRGVAQGQADSHWSEIAIRTGVEQIYLPEECGDIEPFRVTLRWPEESQVSHLHISPGNVERPITPEEAETGIAVITDLEAETDYTITLYNNEAIRGIAEVTTLVDTDTGTVVTPMDDLSAAITAAPDGGVLYLEPGIYEASSGTINVNKSITIQGIIPCDKPVLNVAFDILPGMVELNLVDLELTGQGSSNINTLVSMGAPGNYDAINFRSCYVHDYGRQLIFSNTSGMLLNKLTVDGTVVTDFVGGGGDFIDFRNGDIHHVEITNSTFLRAPVDRDFIRMDNAGDTAGTGVTATVLIDHCTIVDTGNRIAYVRFSNNSITVTNTLFAYTGAIYSNQSSTDDDMTFGNNNYFEAEGLHDSGQTRYDTSSDYSTLDPGFADMENRDFTVTNQSVQDLRVGDPRWLP